MDTQKNSNKLAMITASGNAATLEMEFSWLSTILDARFKSYFQESEFVLPPPPKIQRKENSFYVQLVKKYKLGAEERLFILLALAPHVKPQLLDILFTKNKLYNRNFTEFGGIIGQNHNGMLPTGETIMFVLAGADLDRRFQLMPLFEQNHFFYKHNILKYTSQKKEEPLLSGGITVTAEYLTYLTTGKNFQPIFSSDFPAQKLQTRLDWDDLVLEPLVLDEIEEMLAWVKHRHTIMEDWELGKKLKPGYRAMFYGPPGTGKTLTASLLGKATDMDVYRIDLSQIVSKYIGETEKNMASIFDQAEHKDWILFFDEADALFGKRTATTDSKDRYANQEVAYLLQRIEDFPGTIILATNLKGNIDEAFARRFQAFVYFSMPGFEQRLQLWEHAFSKHSQLAPDVDLRQIAEEYEIAGGAILNILRYCSLAALRNGGNVIQKQDILRGIRREFRKEGKTV